MSVDPRLFAGILGTLPGGVTVVTAMGRAAGPQGLTSTAVCSVSARPPLLLTCVGHGSRTLAAIEESGGFVVNLLASGTEELARRFATKAPDKFGGVAWAPSAVAGGAPVLWQDSAAYAECVLDRNIPAGDHRILIGSIERGWVHDETLPLVYFRRDFVPISPRPESQPAA